MPTFEEGLIDGHMVSEIPIHRWHDLDRDDLPANERIDERGQRMRLVTDFSEYISDETGEIPF